MQSTPAPWYDQECQDVAALAATFFAKEVLPHQERFEAQQHVDRDVWLKAGRQGLLCCSVPAEYGGGGGTIAHDIATLQEQIRSLDTGLGLIVHSGMVAHYLLAYGTDEQKRRWLPDMAAGRLVGAIAMTEPDAGSDLKNLATRATRDGDHYVLSGAKTFISNGGTADLIIVACKTDPAAKARGISLLVVETDQAPGFRRGRILQKLGMHAQDTSELFFDDVPVSTANLLGAEGQGFAMLMEQLPQERLLIGVLAVAAMERALDEAVRHTKTRKAFDGVLFDLQSVRLRLAECATLLRVARVFLDDSIDKHLRGQLDAATASMAKWWLTETQSQVIDHCLQLFGGYGYMREYPIARLYADARGQRIYGGSNEIMKELIARSP
ncbi:acyl-CoA dehydrogenase family protein [Streptomyces sp. BV286]|uniref:acyl-CoA dehydrogenase family protein n=1 Tax=Streptomyces sp. BV286 TaxID=2849672 RepID=UPI001C2E0F04|nr:acyl-CoA dehydrogenase family protein [Streptomyces sp. BV286]MBV1942398.1 acyl-CoA dehydrogenase family protein [Streptomyces sp. BV286]